MEVAALGRFPPIGVELPLIILVVGLVIIDRSCDAFDPMHAACGRLDADPLPGASRHVVALLIYGKSHLPIVDHARIELADTVA